MVDQKALKKFDELYKNTYNDVSRYIVLNCSNLEDAKDIVQNTYLEVYKKIDIIDNKNYILGIAKNMIKKYYRFHYKSKIVSLFSKRDDTELVDTISSDVNIEKDFFNNYDEEIIWKFIKNKSPIISKVIYLYYYEDYTIKEIASILNITESNVKHYLYRTINDLKKYLEVRK